MKFAVSFLLSSLAISACAVEPDQSSAHQELAFSPTPGTYVSAGGPEHSTNPDACGVGHGLVIVRDVTATGYVAEFVLPEFSFESSCALHGRSATCAPRHAWSTLDLRPALDAVLTFGGATGTQWTSATTWSIHDQGIIQCAGTACEDIGLSPPCVINGVQRMVLE